MATRNLGSKAEAFQLEGQTWTCKNDLPSDVTINIGEISFHLHKFPLLSRSGLLQKMINEFHSEDGRGCILQIHDLPGGPKTFELVAKFCYDVRFELNVLNAVPLRCAAAHLRMTEDLVEGNLAAQADGFLGEIFDRHWRDTMRVLEACEPLLPLAEELGVVSRGIEALAAKACADPTIFGWPLAGGAAASSESPSTGRAMWNGIDAAGEKPRSPRADWWYEDASTLSLPMYRRLILGIGSRGMRPETIAGSLESYATKHLPVASGVLLLLQPTTSVPESTEERTIVHEIFELLPAEKGACSTRFLAMMLRAAMVLHASPSCCESLERRIGAQLDDAALEDILVPNLQGYSVETLYDVDCAQRIVESFVSEYQPAVSDDVSSSPAILLEMPDTSSALAPVTAVAKLVDGYLAEVAADVNLKFLKFQPLAAAIPSYARPSDDGIYRAIDIYLKSHPWVSDADREQLCQLMDCQKLSLEACTHAAQNERLPLRVIVQVLFFEQLRLRTTIAGWFYVSDSLDGGGGAGAPRMAGAAAAPQSKKSNGGGAVQSEITVEQHEHEEEEGIKMRVWELERECWKLKEELQKHGGKSNATSKGFWDRFCSKFGVRALGVRVEQHHHHQHGSPRMHKQCNGDEHVSTQC